MIRRALAGQGWIDAQTVRLEMRDAGGDPGRFAQLARELVELGVDLIWADSAPALRATYTATRTIPIIAMDFTTDPVAAGYARSWAKPGGNVTGVFLDAPEISGKWLELLRAVQPSLTRVGVVWDPVAGDTHVKALQALAPSFGVRLQVVEVRRPHDIDAAQAKLRGKVEALVSLPSPMMIPENARVARLAASLRLPATSIFREFAEAGGLLFYGPDAMATVERGAVQVSAILRGAKPGDVPLERPSKFSFVVNLKTASALGLSVPDALLARADAVIR
jgi:putative ABC transport system substrate-binding protein